MRIVATIAVVLAAILAGAIVVAYAGWYDASAREAHSAPVTWFLATVKHNSVERRAAGIDVPDLDDETLVRTGISDYDAMCVECHGAPGREPGAVGEGLNPPPPDLSHAAGHMNAAELFWVTRNGIRMTGMPAWGETHDDDSLWPVVAFLIRLPDLDAAGYEALLASASGSGHHGDQGTKHERGSQDRRVHEHDSSDHDSSEH